MNLPPFKLEEFWKKYEFSVPHLLCCSDAESWSLSEVVAMADIESKSLWDNLSLGYTEPMGRPILRKEIALLYKKLCADQILTFAGAEEGIYCLMRTLVNPGDHVIVIEPCYQSLSTLPTSLGAELTSIRLKEAEGWRLCLDEVQNAMRGNTKLLVLNYPHNPTGALLLKSDFEALIKIARECGAYIFCDEVYRYLEIDESLRLPSIADVYEKGVSLNVMTKAFGLAGLRIGWLASQDLELLSQAASYKLYTSICNSAPSEILALMALRSKEHILKRNQEIMRSNLEILNAFMQRNAKTFSWTPPKGGTMAVLKLLLPISVEMFAEELAKNMGVLIMPGSVFDLSGNYFRIGFGRKNMPAILKMLEEFVNS